MRVATPTIRRAGDDDLPFLSWVMRTAATSHLEVCVWDRLFGLGPKQTDEALSRAVVSPDPHWCHRSRFWVAEREAERVGALVGFDPATEGNEALEQTLLGAVAPMLALSEETLLGIADRGALLQDVTPRDHPGAWGLENVAVVESARGTGVVDALIEHALDEGRSAGHTTAQILCLTGNVRAQRTWERHGFVSRAAYRNDDFEAIFGAPGLTHLRRDL